MSRVSPSDRMREGGRGSDAPSSLRRVFPSRRHEAAAKHGITPSRAGGGSVKDPDVIAAADRLGSRVIKGVRHFPNERRAESASADGAAGAARTART